MAAKSRSDADAVEREILARLATAKFRLRLDKVALRFVDRFKAALTGTVPDGQAALFTISAPIRLPGKTAAALEKLARNAPNGERREIIHGNEVRIRWLTEVSERMPKALCFVHSLESDPGVILDLAEARLAEPQEGD